MSLGGCEFCDLLKAERDKILFVTNQLFIIEDVNTCSAVRHILVCPIEHIESIEDLNGSKDTELIGDMVNLAQKYLLKQHQGKQFRFGFHRPPLVSVYHLHLHGFVLPFQNKQQDEELYGQMLISPQKVNEIIMEKEKNFKQAQRE